LFLAVLQIAVYATYRDASSMAQRLQSDLPSNNLVPFKFRGSGILLHPTSLPGGHGTGDLGHEARRFAKWLHQAGQSYWQMLPLCPPGSANSPYDSPSANAISPLLMSLDELVASGWLRRQELASSQVDTQSRRARFDVAAALKDRLSRRAHERFAAGAQSDLRKAYKEYRVEQSAWLEDHALFCALKGSLGGLPWHSWEPALRDRNARAISRVRNDLSSEIDYHMFVQFELNRQWSRLRRLCNELGILLMGDVPIYVAYDSADVWAHREAFHLDRVGKRKCVAGVPPDYFSKTGQLWGNPLYRWSALKKDGFAWWVERMRVVLSRFDAVRLDHFIGFRHYWEVPAGAKTAERGRYVRVPAEEFFEVLKSTFGKLPFLAEDLGVVTDEIHRLRLACGLPGMKILQFAFDDPNGSDYLPHRFDRDTVVYTGTHDNDTLVGWLRQRHGGSGHLSAEHRATRERALRYLGEHAKGLHWSFIRLALQSVANTAIFPIQDILGLGSVARMNTPATVGGNWAWRMAPDALTDVNALRLRQLCECYERVPDRNLFRKGPNSGRRKT
jgi:4-alpha-glucanotransferase